MGPTNTDHCMSDPNTPDRDVDALQFQYEKARPDFVRLTSKLHSLFSDLLAARGISVHLIEGRTKDVASFIEKITRSSKSYLDPLRELTDLAGIRLIAYYQDDVDTICSLVRDEFLVLAESGTYEAESPSQFGYSSVHFSVQLSDGRAKLAEWGGLAGLTAEIQVRTVLQHSWAAISHKLQYKREEDIPRTLRRKLSRLSALFEIADDEFLALKQQSHTIATQIGERLSAGDQEIALHQISVAKYMETSETVKRLFDIAANVGYRIEREYDESDDDSETVSEIIQLAGVIGVRTVSELDRTLAETLNFAHDYLSTQYHADGTNEPGRWGVTPAFVSVLMLVGARAQHIRAGFLEQLGWDDGIAKRVLKVAKAFVAGRA